MGVAAARAPMARAGIAMAALAAFVLVSSLLGLSGPLLVMSPLGALGFMGQVWGASVTADAVFTLGSVGAACAAYVLARRSTLLSVLAGAALHWLVYFASFLLLPGFLKSGVNAGTLWQAFVFVGSWGITGLVFAALTPPLVRRRRAAREAVGPADTAPEPADP